MNTTQPASLAVRIFGVGNAGVAMLDRVAARPLIGAYCVAVNTDPASLSGSVAQEKVCLETHHLRGFGTGGDPERGRELAGEMFDRLKALCEGVQVVFIFAGLGGGVGGGAAPVLARAAKECGALVIGIVALPFEFEGARRMNQAERARATLREVADGVVCWPNQKIFKLIDANTTVADTLHLANDRIADGVCGLWRLLSQRGLMDVQFAELCAVLRDGHHDAFFASVEAVGGMRASVAVEKLLLHPLLDGGDALTGAGALLVEISAGANLTMAEVGCVMEAINSRCGEVKVFVGATEDAALGESLSITLVAMRPVEQPAARDTGRATAAEEGLELDTEFMEKRSAPRPRSRFVAPSPEMTAEEMGKLAARQSAGAGRGRKSAAKMRQSQLPLEIVSKSRFDKSEPTIRDGQDLDVPTFVRRNMVFN